MLQQRDNYSSLKPFPGLAKQNTYTPTKGKVNALGSDSNNSRSFLVWSIVTNLIMQKTYITIMLYHNN